MGFTIGMGIPEMLALWTELQTKYRDGTIKKKDEELYKKWGNALKKFLAIVLLMFAALTEIGLTARAK